ncbi:MAG: ATP-binding protein [Candidatus Eremiobacteraeota bacterium]|nr:ATP-binding protein [Candidatus Eremiobacteraeota bacterium]
MKQICFLSGKGGTGKTSICAAFASLAGGAVLLDADVESSNLPLVIPHEVLHTEPFYGRKEAVIAMNVCNRCRQCLEACAYGAVMESPQGEFAVTPSLCEGCTLCERVCPSSAISMRESLSGEWHVSKSGWGPLVHASLLPAEEASGKLVRVLRMMAESLAREGEYPAILIDGPAGMGCPAISAMTGCDAVVAVTEPTVAGLHDLERILELSGHFVIPTCLLINKSTLNPEIKTMMEQLCTARGLVIAGELPYDEAFREALAEGKAITEYRSTFNERLLMLWSAVRSFTERPPHGASNL